MGEKPKQAAADDWARPIDLVSICPHDTELVSFMKDSKSKEKTFSLRWESNVRRMEQHIDNTDATYTTSHTNDAWLPFSITITKDPDYGSILLKGWMKRRDNLDADLSKTLASPERLSELLGGPWRERLCANNEDLCEFLGVARNANRASDFALHTADARAVHRVAAAATASEEPKRKKPRPQKRRKTKPLARAVLARLKGQALPPRAPLAKSVTIKKEL